MDPTCRTCSDYPCSCGQAIGVPISHGEGNPMTIRVFGSMTPILYDDYLGITEKEDDEAREIEKETKKKFEEERKARVLGWIHNENIDSEVASIYLTYAARKGDAELCKLALKRGADPTQCCEVGYFRDQKIVLDPVDTTEEGLLKIRVYPPSYVPSSSIHAVTQAVGQGLRPIHIAAAFGNLEVLNVLLENGEKKTTIDCNSGRGHTQFTPLLFAVVNNQVDCVKLLLVSGANYQLDDGFGAKPLDWATKMENKEIQQIFLVWNKQQQQQ